MLTRDGYPAGVPCWVDIVQADLDRTMTFYGGLFEWTFDIRTPEGAPTRYAYALLDGLLVAGVGGPSAGDAEPSNWTTYVWVESADDTVAAVTANGGRVLAPPVDIPRAGRVAVCADPAGAVFGLWQAADNRGAQLVNAPGSWNFSELHAPDPVAAEKFYAAVLGWVCDPLEMGSPDDVRMWRLPGYGDYLAGRDPEIDVHESGGFADAVALMYPAIDPHDSSHWSVTFAVADADAAFARATSLGATVVTPLFDTTYTRMGTIKDPQGATLTLSEYRPPA